MSDLHVVQLGMLEGYAPSAMIYGSFSTSCLVQLYVPHFEHHCATLPAGPAGARKIHLSVLAGLYLTNSQEGCQAAYEGERDATLPAQLIIGRLS